MNWRLPPDLNPARHIPEPPDSQSNTAKLLEASQRKSTFSQAKFSFSNFAGAGVLSVRPQEPREYLMIQNQGNFDFYVGFGYQPSFQNGIQIFANGGWYEPFQVPQDEIFVYCSDPTGFGWVIFANG